MTDQDSEFKPHVYSSEETGLTEMHLEDCATITGQEMTVRPLLRMSDRQIVGFQWWTEAAMAQAPTPAPVPIVGV